MKKKLSLLLLILLLQVDAFGYAKKIVLASFKHENSANNFLNQVNTVISKNPTLLNSFKTNNISANVNKIDNYYIVDIKVFQDKNLLLKSIKTIRKKFKDAYIQSTIIPKKETISKKDVLTKIKQRKKKKEEVAPIQEKIKKSSVNLFSPINIMILLFIVIFIVLVYYALKFKKIYDEY